jgi:cyclase
VRIRYVHLLAVCTCLAGVCCRGTANLPFSLTPVAANVWAAIPNPQAKTLVPANVGVIVGDDGVAVVDTLASVDATGNFSTEPSRQLLGEIRKITPLPVRFVITTHHHLDHVDGNGAFVQAGAAVVGSRRLRDLLKPENLRSFGPKITASQKAFIESLSPPTVTFEETLDLFLGRREVHVRSFPGHSGTDSVVIVPDAKVVFTGDLLWPHMLPTTTDASIEPWVDTLDALAKNEPDATFVPGHGDVAQAQDIVAFREYLVTLRHLVSDAQLAGKSTEEVVVAVMPALTEKYGQWQLFTAVAKENIVDVDSELRGTKRIPKP